MRFIQNKDVITLFYKDYPIATIWLDEIRPNDFNFQCEYHFYRFNRKVITAGYDDDIERIKSVCLQAVEDEFKTEAWEFEQAVKKLRRELEND